MKSESPLSHLWDSFEFFMLNDKVLEEQKDVRYV